ncbi:MAG: NAD-dependent epimerase/dehydratase family protein [Hyphomicrobiales bacterium]|nr:NAD-dependent epimerase/dehydratase family protein [Hyphomicrobiales bacterium]
MRAKLSSSLGTDVFPVKKRVLVAGGAGFLGSHLCERLVKHQHEVLCVDNYVTGSLRNIDSLLGRPAFEAMRHDVTFPLYVEVDEIFNLACPGSPVHYCRDPIQTTKTTVIGTMNMLGLAKRLRARMVQASTCDVHDDSQLAEQVHDRALSGIYRNPSACYQNGNRCAETLCFDYSRQHGVSVRIARIFDAYGPRMHPNNRHLVSNFIMRALNNEPLTIIGSGFQTRSLCYVEDVVEGLIRLMQQDDVDEPLTFASPVVLPVVELARLIISLTGSRSRIEFRTTIQERSRRCPDAELAREALGWSPKIQLEEGLSRTISHHDAWMSRFGEARTKRGVAA